MEFGFQFPGIRYRGNETDMPLGTALVLIEEIPETFFGVVPDLWQSTQPSKRWRHSVLAAK